MSDTIIIDAAALEPKFGADKQPGEQGSVEWLYQRVGKCTGSQFADVMAVRKDGKEAAPRYNYKMELVVERLTGQPAERWVSKYMEWGTMNEPSARMEYEARTGSMVEPHEFMDHPEIANCGGSVDGTIDDDGIIEIKCPTTFNHLETFLNGMPEDHIPQVQGYLWVTNRQWCDFISYDPRLPEHLQLYVQRVARDEAYIAKLAEKIPLFLAEVDEIYARLALK